MGQLQLGSNAAATGDDHPCKVCTPAIGQITCLFGNLHSIQQERLLVRMQGVKLIQLGRYMPGDGSCLTYD